MLLAIMLRGGGWGGGYTHTGGEPLLFKVAAIALAVAVAMYLATGILFVLWTWWRDHVLK